MRRAQDSPNMALSIAQLPRRKKQTTYGKLTRHATPWSSMTSDDSEPPNKVARIAPSHRVTTTKQITPIPTDKIDVQVTNDHDTSKKEVDVWHLPDSTDDLMTAVVPRDIPAKPNVAQRPKKARPAQEEAPKLAPWEVKKTAPPKKQKELGKAESTGSTTTLQTDQPNLSSSRSTRASRRTVTEPTEPLVKQSKDKNTDLAPISAAAKLLAKKHAPSPQKPPLENDSGTALARLKRMGDNAEMDKRKRLRRPDVAIVDDDVPMPDAPKETRTNVTHMVDDQNDVYDFPEPTQAPIDTISKQSSQTHPRNRNVQPRKRKELLVDKYASSPARLTSMLSTESEEKDRLTNVDPRSPDGENQTFEPSTSDVPIRDLPDAPASMGQPASPQHKKTPPRRGGAAHRLLKIDAVPSPSALALEALTLQSIRRPLAQPNVGLLGKSRSDIGQRRPKLVDRLKALAQDSDDEESEIRMRDDDCSTPKKVSTPASPSSSQTLSQSQAQSQSQSRSQTQSQTQLAAVRGGSKITYAKSRSHLQDSTEPNALLDFDLGLSVATPPHSRGRTGAQKAAWDMDDSEDDNEPKTQKFRSIHELRANGDNVRFKDEITGLLDDIADHKISAKHRRRTALTELAMRLTDKAFVQKFSRQGLERQLSAECNATPDGIADCALAAALCALMASEVPEITFTTLRDAGVLQRMARLLTGRKIVAEMVRDRQYSMSKPAQTSFISFASKYLQLDLVWGTQKPPSFSPRIIALKAIEMLVTKLRQSGDGSALMDFDGINDVLPLDDIVDAMARNDALPYEAMSSVSILEALATPVGLPEWPSRLVERVASILTNQALDNAESSDICFLLLRLSHSLLNQGEVNRRVYTTQPMISHLLHAVETGFSNHIIQSSAEVENTDRKRQLDILTLQLGLLMTLAEHSDDACSYAAASGNTDTLTALARIFHTGRARADEAETEAAVVINVAYAYLAVVLAALCRSKDARQAIASVGPRKSPLDPLVAAVEEFIVYNQTVDTAKIVNEMDIDGKDTPAEGADVWQSFTDVLRGILTRLQGFVADASS